MAAKHLTVSRQMMTFFVVSNGPNDVEDEARQSFWDYSLCLPSFCGFAFGVGCEGLTRDYSDHVMLAMSLFALKDDDETGCLAMFRAMQ